MTALHHAWGEVFEVPPTTTANDLLRPPGLSVAVRFLLDG